MVGARERFEALYTAHAGAVLAYARRRTDASSADDVVADVFLVAWRRLDEVPAEALPWLLGIARRVLANRRRGEGRRAALRGRLEGEGLVGVQPGPELPDSEVLRALRALGARDQEVLLLVAWDGLDRRRAAAALGIGAGAFAVRLHRARRRFERALATESTSEVEVSR